MYQGPNQLSKDWPEMTTFYYKETIPRGTLCPMFNRIKGTCKNYKEKIRNIEVKFKGEVSLLPYFQASKRFVFRLS